MGDTWVPASPKQKAQSKGVIQERFMKGLFYIVVSKFRGFPGGSDCEESPSIWEIWVQSLVWEDPLEKGMATHSNILAWRSPGTEEFTGYSPWDCEELEKWRRNDECSWVREIKAASGANDYWDLSLKLYTLKRVTPFQGVCKSYAIWKNVFSLNTKHCRKIARGINTPTSVFTPSLILLFMPPFGSIQAETRVRESWTDAVGRVWCNMFWLTVP